MELSNGYMKNVYDKLDLLPVKGTIDLKAIEKKGDRDKFIAAVKLYIDDNNPGVEFTEGYKKVIRKNNYKF